MSSENNTSLNFSERPSSFIIGSFFFFFSHELALFSQDLRLGSLCPNLFLDRNVFSGFVFNKVIIVFYDHSDDLLRYIPRFSDEKSSTI